MKGMTLEQVYKTSYPLSIFSIYSVPEMNIFYYDTPSPINHDAKVIDNKLGIPVAPFVAADKSNYPALLKTSKKAETSLQPKSNTIVSTSKY